jgi:cytochrome c biogenesis protein CcmG/thiol:disulfide interchange protein DsbE
MRGGHDVGAGGLASDAVRTEPEAVPPGRRPRRSRSLLIGCAIAAVLAVVLFVGVGSGPRKGAVLSPGAPGTVPPNFTLPRLGGGPPVTLDALGVDRHHPVVLNFFASWCGPCRQETPLLARTAAKLRAEHSPIQFVGVDTNDPPADGLAFVRASGVTYPVGVDRSTRVSYSLYALDGLPDTFFIDAQGRVVAHVLGALTPTELNHWIGVLASSTR